MWISKPRFTEATVGPLGCANPTRMVTSTSSALPTPAASRNSPAALPSLRSTDGCVTHLHSCSHASLCPHGLPQELLRGLLRVLGQPLRAEVVSAALSPHRSADRGSGGRPGFVPRSWQQSVRPPAGQAADRVMPHLFKWPLIFWTLVSHTRLRFPSLAPVEDTEGSRRRSKSESKGTDYRL